MRRQKQYVIFIDIDGTLYTSANGIPRENIEVIRKVREQGHLVLINTGRSYGNIPDVILESVPVDGFVCALGSDVRFRGKQLYSAALSQEQLRKVVQFYLEEKKYCILEGEDDVFVINPRKQSSKIPITSPDDFEKLYPGSLINIFTIPGRITDRERELFGGDFFFVEHPDFFEGALKGNSKSRGMEVILNHLGMTAQDCIAMGDSMNDYDMLKYAGISIAMEDSPEKLIAISDAVAKTADEGGVADALREFVLDK